MSKNAHWLWKHVYYGAEAGPISKISNLVNRVMAIKLNKLINEINPEIIISTHPFSSQMCALLKKKGEINCKVATVLTDYAPHGQWLMYPEYVDYFFVAHEGMKEKLKDNGISEEKIYATGIPLSIRFLVEYNKEEILQEFGLQQNKTTILFFAGGEFGFGSEMNIKILKVLINQFKNIQVIVVSGKNTKIKERFEEIVKEANSEETVKVLAYTNKVPELMSISDLVISKPGGLTTTESLASGLPIIVINPIPGQEEENAEFLESHNAGIWIRKKDNAEEKLKEILLSNEKINEMKINARLLAKKNSTKEICKICLGDSE